MRMMRTILGRKPPRPPKRHRHTDPRRPTKTHRHTRPHRPAFVPLPPQWAKPSNTPHALASSPTVFSAYRRKLERWFSKFTTDIPWSIRRKQCTQTLPVTQMCRRFMWRESSICTIVRWIEPAKRNLSVKSPTKLSFVHWLRSKFPTYDAKWRTRIRINRETCFYKCGVRSDAKRLPSISSRRSSIRETLAIDASSIGWRNVRVWFYWKPVRCVRFVVVSSIRLRNIAKIGVA